MTEEFARRVDIQLHCLCEITDRECERILSDLIVEAQQDDRLARLDRVCVAALALEYAQRRSELDRYRALIRGAQVPITRVK